MNNNLVTRCDNCVFQKNKACQLEYPIERDRLITQGFCKFKMRDPASIEEVTKANSEISVIIMGNNVKAIEESIINLFNINNEAITEIVVSCYNISTKSRARLLKALNESTFPYQLIENKTNVSLEYVDYILMDNAVDKVKNNWFISIKDKPPLSSRDLELICSNLKSRVLYNNLCLYWDFDKPTELFSNKFAFIELESNSGLPYLEKLKEFDNFDKICYRMDQ